MCLSLYRTDPADCILVSVIGMKCADLSHVVRPFAVAQKWEELLQQEFFLQGDMEKVSMHVLCACSFFYG